MNCRIEKNGDLVISAETQEEQGVIDAIMAAITAYEKTFEKELRDCEHEGRCVHHVIPREGEVGKLIKVFSIGPGGGGQQDKEVMWK